MKKDWKYIVYLSVVVGIFVAVKLMEPRQYDWSVSLAHDDKNPFGSYAFNELLPSLFQVKNSYQTLYELKDSIGRQDNLLILATTFNPGTEDTEALLRHVERGGMALISAEYFNGKFADTLGITTQDYIIREGNVFSGKDTAALHFSNPQQDTTAQYPFRRDNIHNYFYSVDSADVHVVARNDKAKPVTLLLKRGKGKILLNSTPLVFTNIHLLSGNNHRFVSSMLSYLPAHKLWWTEFYHLGRMEAQTPLRFILTTEPLRWGYYIALVSILLFMTFEAKRKQRIIPVIRPLANTTLEFISTIGNLYYQRSDHKNLAEKKIQYFHDQVRTRYFLGTHQRDRNFITTLAKKSGASLEKTERLIGTIEKINAKNEVTEAELLDLNRQLELFWKQQA